MKQNLAQKIAKFIREHRMKKQWQMAATVMAAVVVFSTTYALILPAITLTKDNVYTASDCQTGSNSQMVHVGQMGSGPAGAATEVQTPSNAIPYYCGFEAHTHDKHCYNEEGNLTCELTVHVHTDECLVQFTEEELALIQNVVDMIAELPTSEEAEAALAAFEEAGDKDGYEAYVKAIAEIAWAAHDAYEALDEELKAEVTNIDLLNDLEWLWSATILFEYPSLEADGAYVSKLKDKASKVIVGSDNEELEAMLISNGDAVEYQFSVETDSYSDMYYSEGRVKVEFVLPFTAEQAEFDLTDMNWLDDSEGYEAEVTTETRTIGDEEIECQVLTGYKYFAAEEASEEVIPGNFTGNVVVSVNEMEHNSEIAILISAAMEHNEWDGECAEHEREEKLTITTDEYKVYAPLSPEEQKVIYEAFLAEVEEAEVNGLWTEELRAAAEELLERVQEAYAKGEISEEYYSELSERIEVLLNIVFDPRTIAEPAIGDNWDKLMESGWFEEYSDYAIIGEVLEEESVGTDEIVSLPMMFKSRARMMAAKATIGDSVDSSDVQVDRTGGSNTSSDGKVTVSKTIAGTELENIFDITLKVETNSQLSKIYEEPDMAVVIVMDISNTMRTEFGTKTRYEAAMVAAENFIDQFRKSTGGVSRVGYVAFNTDAHKIFDLSVCSNETQANNLKNQMRTGTGNIIDNYKKNAAGDVIDTKRYTNIEAGLKLGYDMLKNAKNANKYIIFLSDGFPTTHIKSGYTGYNPEASTDNPFYDSVLSVPCSWGTSYSEKSAIKARECATTIKNNGVTIFSIGVDVGGQTIKKYEDQSTSLASKYGVSVVDRKSTTYEIGSASEESSYKNWLKNKIGSGYYYDSTDTEGLNEAYESIFAEITRLIGEASEADWVAEDPMPTAGSGESAFKTVEFIGFYDQYGTLITSGNLSGSNSKGGENTAEYISNQTRIDWDLKKSGYSSTEVDGTTKYMYQLKYRVRLRNEKDGFVEKTTYDTNDKTVLMYKLIETIDGIKVKSEERDVEFPIPAVHGYLGELEFTKIDSFNKVVEGAEFTLTHDRLTCSKCRGDGADYVDVVNDRFSADEKYVAVSGTDGKVTFTRIPSGHTYSLVETKVPAGYSPTDKNYQVVVEYDVPTVNVKDAKGNVFTWDGTIVNHTSYELPQTGGPGTWFYTLSGLLLTVGTMIFGFTQRRRQERRAL